VGKNENNTAKSDYAIREYGKTFLFIVTSGGNPAVHGGEETR